MFREERDDALFEWTMLGNAAEGRPNLGFTTDVSVYRLMQFTLRDAMIQEFGVETADRIFYRAGETAGLHFYENVITKKESFNDFIADLQEMLKSMKIGILRVEKGDIENMAYDTHQV